MQSIKELNSKLITIYIFQYSLFIPLMTVIPATYIVLVTSLVIIFCLVFLNKKNKIHYFPIVFSLLLLLVEVIKVLLGSNSSLLLYGTIIPIPSILIFLYEINEREIIEFGFKISIINFFLIFLVPFTSGYEYMRFGYGILLTCIFMFTYLLNYREKLFVLHRIITYIILCISVLEMFVYGARGCMFAFLLYLALYSFVYSKGHIIRNLMIILSASCIYINLVGILDFFEKITMNLGLKSYAITKYKMQLMDGFAVASSHRDKLYIESFEKIKLHPITGNVINLNNSEDNIYVFANVAGFRNCFFGNPYLGLAINYFVPYG